MQNIFNLVADNGTGNRPVQWSPLASSVVIRAATMHKISSIECRAFLARRRGPSFDAQAGKPVRRAAELKTLCIITR